MDTLTQTTLKSIAQISRNSTFRDDSSAAFGIRLANALGWGEHPARMSLVETRVPESLQITQGYIGPQRAMLFAADGVGAQDRRLPDAALYAYHSAVHWGMIADSTGAIVFNSHRVRNGDWYSLPPIQWASVDRHVELIEALTPEGLAAGRIDAIAARTQEADRFLTPVDDALLAHLEYWRREAYRYSGATKDIEEALHTLFVQLFMLRVVEDRGLAPSVPPLREVINGGFQRDRLRHILNLAAQEVQSQLFDESTIDNFPDFVIAGLIGDLYTPPSLPSGSQRYNFAWLDADVLGRAYEKYLASVFRPLPPPAQLRLLDQPERDIEVISVKRSGGIYYTPDYLVATLTESAVQAALVSSDEADAIPRIVDFACGSGAFLAKALDVLLPQLRMRDPERDWVREIIDGKRVVGIDIDYRAVLIARFNLWNRLATEPSSLPLPSLDDIIVQGDSLGADVWERLPDAYDVVLGNPPFIAAGNVSSRDSLTARFRTAQGRFDYSYLFVELAVSRLAEGGALGMVVPNRLFRNRDAETIRDILISDTRIVCVLDFGSNEVFPGTSAYIGSIVATRPLFPDTPSPETLRAVIIRDIGEARYLGGAIIEALIEGTEVQSDAVAGFDVKYPSAGSPWLLLSTRELLFRILLEENGTLLTELASIFQGIRTGANDIFILTIESTDGDIAKVTNGLGETAIIETDLLRPVAFGSDIRRYEALSHSRWLLYPYRLDTLVPEVEMQHRYPKTWAYLNIYHDILASRASIRSTRLRWYELVRRRAESWLFNPKLVMRDLAPETSFSIDSEGTTALVGGTAVVPFDPNTVWPLLAYLNSSVASGYISELAPSFRGGYRKYEPQHLERLYVPDSVLNDPDISFKLGVMAKSALDASTTGDYTEALAFEKRINELLISVIHEPQHDSDF